MLLINEFRKISYKYKKSNLAIVYKEDLKKLGVEPSGYQMQTSLSKEEEYEKMMMKIDIDNWENKRVPRPWDEKFSESENKK